MITKAQFPGRIVMLGCGSIGQAVLPTLHKHLAELHGRIVVLAANEAGRGYAENNGATFIHAHLTPANYRTTLKKYLTPGDLLLNLSIDVSSLDLIRFCADRQVLYVDTSIEPWPGVFDNPMVKLYQRTNFAIRLKTLELAKELGATAPTAVVDHGANPGMVSHMVKQALLNLNQAIHQDPQVPTTRAAWAALAQKLNITTIQISERDTQASRHPKRQDEFINTWSIEGFIAELMQPAELAYGTFERQLPKGAKEHRPGSHSLYLQRPGCSTFARSWVPSIGSFQGMLVTHDEIFSIADYLTVRDGAQLRYRPSVMFVYHPCDDAMLSALELEGNGWVAQTKKRLLGADIVAGCDELGVLLAGHAQNAYWLGSQLSIEQARQHVAYTNATTMQVVAGAMSGLVWAINNPRRGIVEPEDLDHAACLKTATPYLGPLVGEFTEWTPLDGRGKHFPEKLDVTHPWQLQNIRSRQWPGE